MPFCTRLMFWPIVIMPNMIYESMECVGINFHEHSPGDIALVVPMLPPVSSCSQHHIHCYTSLFLCLKSMTLHQFAVA